MITTATHLSRRLGADERTVRRGIEQGLIRVERRSARRLEIEDKEEGYLREYWDLLTGLRAALRTEPSVRFAALFGSVARGDDDERSDLDLLVDLRDDTWQHRQQLINRLEARLQRRVDLAVVGRLAKSNRGLLSTAVEDGRVLVDRGNTWPKLKAAHPRLRKAARAEAAREERRAEDALREVVVQ